MDQTTINILAIIVAIGMFVSFFQVLRHAYKATGKCRSCPVTVGPGELECAECWGDRQ